MNSVKANGPRVDAAGVAAEAHALMRRNGNYRRAALTMALMYALTNVPVMLVSLLLMPSGAAMAAQGVVDMRASVFQIMMQLLVAPAFGLSFARFMLDMKDGSAGSPMDLFEGLTRGSYFVAVRANLWRMLSMFVWLMIPASIMSNGLALYMVYGTQTPLMWLGLALVLAVAVNRALAYSLQYYFLARQPQMGAVVSLRLSVALMRGRALELFKIYLRFLPRLAAAALPNVAAQVLANGMFGLQVDDQALTMACAGLALASIALTSLLMPVMEAASAIYFARLTDWVAKQTEEAMRAHGETPGAPGTPGALPGWGGEQGAQAGETGPDRGADGDSPAGGGQDGDGSQPGGGEAPDAGGEERGQR